MDDYLQHRGGGLPLLRPESRRRLRAVSARASEPGRRCSTARRRSSSTPLPFTSSYLSSGWVSLRNEWQGNRAWVGLNALIPGGGHQHADRLTLLSYSHGQLLALEKATPYNESVTRQPGHAVARRTTPSRWT